MCRTTTCKPDRWSNNLQKKLAVRNDWTRKRRGLGHHQVQFVDGRAVSPDLDQLGLFDCSIVPFGVTCHLSTSTVLLLRVTHSPNRPKQPCSTILLQSMFLHWTPLQSMVFLWVLYSAVFSAEFFGHSLAKIVPVHLLIVPIHRVLHILGIVGSLPSLSILCNSSNSLRLASIPYDSCHFCHFSFFAFRFFASSFGILESFVSQQLFN